MAVAGYQYRVGTEGAWVDAAGPTVSLTGLQPGTMYGFQTRSVDTAGICSDPTPLFYQTTPYRRGLLAVDVGGVTTAIQMESGECIEVLIGNYTGRS